jgi:hypothetical protein
VGASESTIASAREAVVIVPPEAAAYQVADEHALAEAHANLPGGRVHDSGVSLHVGGGARALDTPGRPLVISSKQLLG